ncbi:hypothetical protein T484DRAFT_1877129, partial [Baffinella frigidus]
MHYGASSRAAWAAPPAGNSATADASHHASRYGAASVLGASIHAGNFDHQAPRNFDGQPHASHAARNSMHTPSASHHAGAARGASSLHNASSMHNANSMHGASAMHDPHASTLRGEHSGWDASAHESSSHRGQGGGIPGGVSSLFHVGPVRSSNSERAVPSGLLSGNGVRVIGAEARSFLSASSKRRPASA